MRIANSTIIYNFLSGLNKSQGRMNDYQKQMSDGKIVHNPSDDPVRAIRSLRLNTNLMTNEQFTQNAKDAQSWLNQTDEALSGMSELLARAREIVIDAVSPNPSIAYTAAATEIDGLINKAVELANTQNGDRYVFAGQQDKVVGGPFERTTIAGIEQVIYRGDNNKISLRLQTGAANPREDSINVTGTELFGPMDATGADPVSTIFRSLLDIKDELATGNPDMNFLSTTALTSLDTISDNVLLNQTEIGARMATYEMSENLLLNNYTTIYENTAANDSIDLAKVTVDFKNSENLYNAALAIGARIMPQSLVDFLQ